ncbi:MAG: TetR/AcrR family transcriptional regulator [Galactobacter sp.]
MPRPRRYDAAVRNRLLQDAALISATEGPSALSARRLATQSGTTTAAIYTLFGGMNSLRAALTAQALADLKDALNTVPANPDPVQQLFNLSSAYRDWAVEHPHEYRSVFNDALGKAVRHNSEPPRATSGPTSRPRQNVFMAQPTEANSEFVAFTTPGVYLDSVHEAWHAVLEPIHSVILAGLESGAFTGSADQAGPLALAVVSLLHGGVSLEVISVLEPTLSGFGASVSTPGFFELATQRLVAGLISGGFTDTGAPISAGSGSHTAQ